MTVGTHFSKLAGRMEIGTTFPDNPATGQEFFDPTTNTQYIYDGTQWWGAGFTTSTSTSTTTTSTSTTSSTTTSTSSSTTTTSTSTSTTL